MSLEPPDYLDDQGKTIWRGYLEEILAAGNTANIPPDRLAELVSATQQQQRAIQLLATTQPVIIQDGRPVANPAVHARDTAGQVITRLRREFGLNRRPMRPDGPIQSPELGRWCPQHERWECTHQRSRGRGDCHRSRRIGTNSCDLHLGQRAETMPEHILAVERRSNPLAGDPMDIKPAEALLWRVRVLAGEVQRLDLKIATLDERELVWGETEVTTTDGEQPVTRRVESARLSVWLQLRAQRERQLQSACEAALHAGVEAAMVDLAREQVALMHRVLVVALGRWAGIREDDARLLELPAIIREVAG